MLSQLQQKLGEVKENEPLANHTTFKIGGPAKYFFVAQNSTELLKAVQAAEELNISFFILGWGSNLLVSDAGFAGLVIKTTSDNFRVEGEEIFAEAGVNLSRLVGIATQAGLTGLEFVAGIPGTVGGAARGNAGAYGKGFGDLVTEAEIYKDAKIKKMAKSEISYSYRESIFKHQGGVILSVKIKLEKGDQQKIQEEVIAIIKSRKEKLPWEPSAGCIFKNIELANTEIDKEKIIKELGITAEEWEKTTAHGKLPVGYIIDHLGLKGKKIGGCQVSEKHSAFFVNTGEAKAEHVLMLMSGIKMRVRNQLLIQLQEEVQYLGF